MSARAGWWIIGTVFGLSVFAAAALGVWAIGDLWDDWSANSPIAAVVGNPTPRTFIPANNPTTLVIAEAPADGDTADITHMARVMNGSTAPALPASFHTSVASPARQPPVNRKGSVARVQMPSRSPVRSPYVANGRVFAPGGFASNELHCFDAATLQPLWSATLGDPGPSAVAATDDYVMVNTESCTLFVLDAATGQHRWSWYLGDPQMAMPAVADGRVYASYPAPGGLCVNYSFGMGGEADMFTGSHGLACFDLAGGQLLWQKWIDGDVLTQPTPHGDRVYAATFSGTMYQFDATTGDILTARRARATSAPVVRDGQLIYTCRVDGEADPVAQEAIAVDDAATGKPIARFHPTDAPHIDRRVQEHTSYAHSGRALDYGNGLGDGVAAANNVDRAWVNVGQGTVSNLQAFQGSRIAAAGDRLFTTKGDTVYCIDKATRQELWSHKVSGARNAGGSIATAPVVVGDAVLIATLAGDLLHLNAATGTLVTTYPIGSPVRSQPAVMDGRIYVGTEKGELVMIDTGDPTLTGWAGFGAQ